MKYSCSNSKLEATPRGSKMMAPFPAAATAAAIHLILVECQRMKGYIYGSMVHGDKANGVIGSS